MQLRSLAYLLYILMLSSSCALKEEAKLDFPSGTGKLFVESYLSPGEPIKLSLMRTSSFQEDLSLQLVWNAKAELILPDTIIRLQNIFYKDSGSGKLVNYVSTNRIPFLMQEDSIRLRIVTENKLDTLHAVTKLTTPVKISGFQIDEQKILVYSTNGNLPENRYYGIYLEYTLNEEVIRKSEYYDYSRVTDQELSFQLNIPPGQRPYRVILYRITAANYEFQRALQKASRSNVDPFEAPIILPGTIKGGQGIFTYTTADTVLIKQSH